MTPNQQQEEIGKAYVHAVAAACGFSVSQWSQDHGCIDTTISADRVLGEGPYSKPKVDLQLKATTQDVVKDEHIAWSLEMAHYDKLRARARVPHLLVDRLEAQLAESRAKATALLEAVVAELSAAA